MNPAGGGMPVLRQRFSDRFWGWVTLFPGDLALAAPLLAAAVAAALLEVLWLILFVRLGPSAAPSVGLLPYLLAAPAFAIFPGSAPLLERLIGPALAFWLGGAPAAWAYVALAAAAPRGGHICRAAWTAASWLPSKVCEILRRLRHRRPLELRPARPLSRRAIVILLLLTLAALGYRFARISATPSPLIRPEDIDAAEYDALARQLVARQPLALDHSVVVPASPPLRTRANRTPGYPAFLAAIYSIVPGPPDRQCRAALHVQGLLNVLAGLLLFIALRRILPNWAAACALVIWLVLPPESESAFTLLPESLSAFLLSAVLCLCLSTRHPLAWAAAAFLSACAVMVRPEFVALPVVLAIAIAVLPGMRLPQRAWRIALMAAVFSLAFAPWVIRNYRVLGTFVPTSTAGGFSVWAGNYLPFRAVVRLQSYDLQRQILRRQSVNPSDEVALDRAMWREGFRNIAHYLRTRPLDYLGLICSKCRHACAIPIALDLGHLGSYDFRALILFLSLLGAAAALLNWRLLFPLLALPAYQAAVHAFSYAQECRYFLCVMPIVIGLVTFGIWFAARPPDR